jgi:hypothetical protein
MNKLSSPGIWHSGVWLYPYGTPHRIMQRGPDVY